MGKKSELVDCLPHSCGSSDGLMVYYKEDEDKYDGYCFVCNTYESNPYKHKPEDFKPEKKTLDNGYKQRLYEEIFSYGVHDVPSRGLKSGTLNYFGVKIGVSTNDGTTPFAMYFPYANDETLETSGYKCRIIDEKKMFSRGNMKGAYPFGWKQALAANRRTLYITEGEIDAISLFQMLRKKLVASGHKMHIPAVISLPNGSGSVKRSLSHLVDTIRKGFTQVIFVPDRDEAGRKAAEEISKIFPEIMVADPPCKDANEAMMSKDISLINAYLDCVQWRASKKKNSRLVRGSTVAAQAKKKPEWGKSWPWEHFNQATRGRRRGETYYFGAGTKMGKSEIVNAIAAHIIINDGLPVFLAKPEEALPKTYKMVLGKVAGRIFHDPTIEFDEEAFDAADEKVGDQVIMLDLYQNIEWETLKEDILVAVTQHGVKDVILDPITCLTNHLSASDANELLTKMASEISAMAKDHDFTAYLFCHLKAPGNGKVPHEMGGKVLSSQFHGSRAMMRSCNLMIGIEGNKDPEQTIEERNTRILTILEDREFGVTGRFPLLWDYKTGMFEELPQF